MPILRQSWFADHSPGVGFFVATAAPTTGMTDCNAAATIPGPVPTGVTGSSKFTFSIWCDAASLNDGSGITIDLSANDGTNHKDFQIENIAAGLGMDMVFHTSAGVGGSVENLATGASIPATGYVNIIFSADISGTPKASIAICSSALGIGSDYSNKVDSIFSAYPGGTTIPFDLTPDTPSGEWQLEASNGMDDGPFIDWVTLIIGTYYDLTVAANRRLFNVACSGSTLVPIDTTPLSPILLMHGGIPDFLTNHADSSVWTNNPAELWISAPGIPPCP